MAKQKTAVEVQEYTEEEEEEDEEDEDEEEEEEMEEEVSTVIETETDDTVVGKNDATWRFLTVVDHLLRMVDNL